MYEVDMGNVKKVAQAELEDEEFHREVEKMKIKLKEKKTFWDRIFPWEILIIKKEVI